jgi:flagellar hook-associated protein 1 FlgK
LNVASNLFGILSTAARGLETQRVGLDVTGQNIANINTPGYSRRTLDIVAVPPATRDSAGGGADVATIRSQRDRLVERRLQLETSGSSQYSTIADTIGQIESAIGTGSSSLDSRLNAFFDSATSLADRPTDAVARQDVLLQASSLAKSFNGTVSRLQQIGRETDQRVISTVGDINSLTDRIAKLNGIITTSPDPGASLHAQDEQQDLVNQLSALTDVRVSFRSEGGVDLDTASGRSLVIGGTAYAMSLGTTGVGGNHTVSIQGADITSTLTGGSLGGLISVRDTTLPGYIQSLDGQASALAAAVNAVQTAGYDLDGNAGQAFFTFSTPPQGVVGAAAALQVNPALAANGRLIAAAGTAQPGDNQGARAIAAVREARLLDNGTSTLIDSWGQFVGRVGLDVQSAGQERDVRTQIVGQLQSLRDQVSGVSLDEEALNLTKFQRAYEANAKLFAAVDDATQTLLNMVGR